MEDAVLSLLENLEIDINNCRGQSYDNASNMSGAYTGLQARIVKHNSLAMYVPCSAHSLNSVGSCGAECVPEVSAFFNTIQTIFTFFAASTNKYFYASTFIYVIIIIIFIFFLDGIYLQVA